MTANTREGRDCPACHQLTRLVLTDVAEVLGWFGLFLFLGVVQRWVA